MKGFSANPTVFHMIFGQARGINLSFRRIIVHRFITIAFVGLMACTVANQTTKTTQNGSISGPTKPEVSAPSTPKTISRKLIEFGWDKPVPAAITTTKLEASPFDGVIFRPVRAIGRSCPRRCRSRNSMRTSRRSKR